MPQMMPLNWMYLMFFSIMIFYIWYLYLLLFRWNELMMVNLKKTLLKMLQMLQTYFQNLTHPQLYFL